VTQPSQVLKSVAERYAKLNQMLRTGESALRDATKFAWPVGKDALGMATRQGIADRTTDVDATQKRIRFVISTQNVDRDGDVVVSRGIKVYPNYARNPVWSFSHFSWDLPVGKMTDPQGKLCFFPEEFRVCADCWFDVHDPDAMFLFGKYERGFMNATSIAFVPEVAYPREKAHEEQRNGGWKYAETDLTEVALTPVPANPEALRDDLDKEKNFISPKLYKGLSQYAARARGKCFTGYCPCPPCEEKDFREADHPRADDGKFGPKNGLPGNNESAEELPTSEEDIGAKTGKDAYEEADRFYSDVLQTQYAVGHQGDNYVYVWSDKNFDEGEIPDKWLNSPTAERGALVGSAGEIRWELENCVGSFRDPDLADEDQVAEANQLVDQLLSSLGIEDVEPVKPKASKSIVSQSHLGQFLHAQKVKDMSKKLNANTLKSALGSKPKKAKCGCGGKCASCRKSLPEEDNATSGEEATGTHPEHDAEQEHGANELDKDLQSKVQAKMPKLMECGYSEPQAMCLAAHLHGKGLEGDDITGHEEVAMALGYKSKDESGDMGGDVEMSLKSFVKSVKKESEAEESQEENEASEGSEHHREEEAHEGGEHEEETEADKKPEEKYKKSAAWLGAMHNHMKSAHSFTTKEMELCDHPQMAKAMGSHLKDLEGHMENYKSLADKYHPDLQFEKMCKDLGGEEEAVANETGEGSSSEADSAPTEEKPGKGDKRSGADIIREDYQEPKKAKGQVRKSMVPENAACLKEAGEYLGEMANHPDTKAVHKAGMKYHAGMVMKCHKDLTAPQETAPAQDVGDTMKSFAGTLDKVQAYVDYEAECYFEATGQRL